MLSTTMKKVCRTVLAVTLLLGLPLAASAQIPQSASVMTNTTHSSWAGTFSNTYVAGGPLKISYYSSTATITYDMANAPYGGGYYYTSQPCSYGYMGYSTPFYPPNGGTILRAYVYLLWQNICGCGNGARRSYVTKASGAVIYSGVHLGWGWVDFADYAAGQGIRVYGGWNNRRCNAWYTTYLRYVEVLETRDRYYTVGDYYSVAVDRGAKGYDWGFVDYSVSVPAGTGCTIYVRGSATTSFTSTWTAVSQYQNLNSILGTNRYMQYRVRLTGPGTYTSDVNGSPTFNWFRIYYYYDNNFPAPEAHDNEFWYDSTASFGESGASFSQLNNGGGYGLRLSQYNQTVTYDMAVAPYGGSYYATAQPCTNGYWYSTPFYPPNGGTITRAYAYLLWQNVCGCGNGARRSYIMKGNGTTIWSGDNGSWGWRDFADYPASQGIRVYGGWNNRRCNAWYTTYLRYVDVLETKYYTSATWTSAIKDYSINGFSWAHISWLARSTGGSNQVYVDVRAAADAAFSQNVLGWTNVANHSNLATLIGSGRRYFQFRVRLTGTATTTPEMDWITIKYYTDAKPTIVVTSTDKGTGPWNTATNPYTPPTDNGWHDKPPVNGEPSNDQPYATISPNTVPPNELGINVTITDPENDPIKTVSWEYSADFTDDGDDLNDMWFAITETDISWSDGDAITVVKNPGSYKLIWINLQNYLSGIYQNIYFRCLAHDQIFASDSYGRSTAMFIDLNSPPAINAATFAILPDPAYTTDTLTLNTSASGNDVDTTLNQVHTEDDNNILTYVTSWSVNGIVIPGITQPVLPSSYFIKGDTVTVKVYPYDGKEFGSYQEKSIVIQNKPPVITSITLSPATPYTDDDLICTVVATDDDEFIWRETDFRSATVNNFDDGNGSPFDSVNCDGNITTTDVDQDNEWELQLK